MTTIRLTRQVITVKMQNGTSKDVMAWVYENNLAIHKDNVLDVWSITHVKSGYQVASFGGKYNKIRPLVGELDSLLDWGIENIDLINSFLYNAPYKKIDKLKRIITKYEEELHTN